MLGSIIGKKKGVKHIFIFTLDPRKVHLNFYKKLKNVSCEYDRWVVETQLCKLRDTSDTLNGRACPMFQLKLQITAVLLFPSLVYILAERLRASTRRHIPVTTFVTLTPTPTKCDARSADYSIRHFSSRRYSFNLRVHGGFRPLTTDFIVICIVCTSKYVIVDHEHTLLNAWGKYPYRVEEYCCYKA